MSRLSLTVDAGEHETPTSFASRLAARNLVSGRLMAQDFVFDFQKIVDGDTDEIRRLADLGRANPDALIAHAVKKEGTGFELRGQSLTKKTIRRARVHVCPACIRDNIATSDLPPHCAAYGRSEWSVAAIRTCGDHDMALVEAAAGLGPRELHDFARNIAPMIPDVGRLAAEAVRRQPSGLETYLLRRLDGRDDHPWLDALPFHAAAWTTEIVGAVAHFGKQVHLGLLSEDQRHEAGVAGFEILRQGAAGLAEFMTSMKQAHKSKRGGAADGPQATYGKLFMTFSQGLPEPAFDPVRGAMEEHILDNFPLGPEDQLFGKPVARRFHSIRTASKHYDMHPKRLRKLIEAEGLVTGPHLYDRDVLFDADVADRLFKRQTELLTLKETETYLNAPRPTAQTLFQAGLIQRHVVGSNMNEVFRKSELDAFLANLYRHAVAVPATTTAMMDVAKAAKRVNASTAEVVRLVHEGALRWVGRQSEAGGVLGLLVDVEEVREHTKLPELDGVAPFDARFLLRVSSEVMRGLLQIGAFQTTVQRHPIKRNPQTVIPHAEIKRFLDTYVSLFTLARECEKGLPKLRRELAARGITPAFDREVGATFFRRSDLT